MDLSWISATSRQVRMRGSDLGAAEAAYAAALQLDPSHRGALVNIAHVLGQWPPSDAAARARLLAVGRLGVAAGLWSPPLQRPPHSVKGLDSRPWHDAAAFAFTGMLCVPAVQISTVAASMHALMAPWPGSPGLLGRIRRVQGRSKRSGGGREPPRQL